MTMPTAEIEMIMAQLKEMRSESKHDNERLHDKLDKLNREGCAKAAGHSAAQADHESRLRKVEDYTTRQAGQVAMIGGVSGFAAVVCGWVGKALMMKIGGNG